ncbi:SDR family oxidoreductase [Robiginitalea sp. M366]|uniref:SDR family oxidoreductase n=1 Tax=Robiginitalea aestuariiviva TaxID=3036903 RepID=UPI00240DE5B8|nr:SDR family oxidoreductase [Robiginitalea aestuariiviva]MDG1573071.1 SDR family oxidoreductase [Robiginitalea aestuariiviva]
MYGTDTVVWITGASSGIGEALSYHLSELGCWLILSARREERLREVRNACASPERVALVPLDLGVPDTLPERAAAALACYGRVDVLVNNAGLSQRSKILDTEMAVYERLMQVNYLGTVALSKALLPAFLEQGSGHYATVTSLMGKFGSPLRSGYCGAKHALHGFFDVLRMEHGHQGIQVSMICPGFVQTDVARNALTATGAPQQKQDQATAAGMAPDRFARKMWRAICKGKWETYIGGQEVMGIYLKRFFPRLLHRVVLRSQVV